MKLVIVESPTKAKTLSKFLPKEYTIESSMGHIRDLPKSGLGVDVDNDFTPEYVPLASKKKQIAVLRKYAKTAEDIYLATDPDREGEAIAFHVAYLLGKHDYKRVTFHEITRDAIEHAMKEPGSINDQLVDAQQARRVLDRLVGYKLSPVLWKKVRRGLSAGRVQSVAVRLIIEKEREIEAFEIKEYWEIFVELLGTKDKENKESFIAQLSKKDSTVVKIGDENTSKKIVSDLKDAKYVISDVSERKHRSSPPPPFTTSTLQQTASRIMGWSSKRTMSVAQQLYERGYITYHRTDSFNLASSAITQIRAYIGKTYGDKYLPKKLRLYKTKSKSAQEAHEAVRPTDVKVEAESLKGSKINSSHHRLYELIRNRLLQCQMTDAEYDKSTILVSAGVYELVARGNRLLFDGWLKLGKAQDDMLLPKLVSGEELELKDIDPQQKFTKPPARYSEASLIKELEKRGIGRPSTYASIISTIQDRMYVEKQEKRFHPTSIGFAVTDFLVTNFGKVMAYEFTAQMEDDLDAIAEGTKKWVKVLSDFWKPFIKKVEDVEKNAMRVEIPTEKTGKTCPTCKKGDVVIRTGRFGKFLSCSRFPDCDYTEQHVEYMEGVVCPDDGGRVIVRTTRRGKTFYGCENYPKCKWATWQKPKPGQELEPSKSSKK